MLAMVSLATRLEADIQLAQIGATGFSDNYDFRSNLNSFGTLRGRLGYAAGPALFYLTGGLAYGDLQKTTNAYGPYYANSTLDTSAMGYVLGGGVEYQLNQNWSLKAEYQYVNLGKNDVCAAPAYQCFGSTNTIKDDDFHMVRLGVNFHF
jgi:outer membrane immunogenic protein